MKYGLHLRAFALTLITVHGTQIVNQFNHGSLLKESAPMHIQASDFQGAPREVSVNLRLSQLSGVRARPFRKPNACSPVESFLPTFAQIMLVLMVLFSFKLTVPSSDCAESARSVFLLQNGFAYINFSIVILDSYSLASQMGRGPAFSGAVIGIYMMGLGIGAVAGWTLFKVQPLAWKDHGRSILLFAQCLQLIGAVGYTFVAVAVTYDIPLTVDGENAMLASRVFMGLGAGMCTNLAQVSFIHLTPKDDRPKQMVRFMMANMTGIAMGPLLASTQGFLDFCPGVGTQHARFELVGLVKVVNCLGTLAAVLLWYPRMQHVEDNEPAQVAVEHQATDKISIFKDPRTWVLAGCLMVNIVCPLCISALESATSFLLETSYDWNRNDIGVVVSGTFLAIAPLRCAYTTFKDKLSEVGWIRLLSAFVMIGSVLMITKPHTPLKLLVADAIMFPCLCWVNSLAVGIAQQHLFPQGSWLDASNFVLAHLCAGNLISRTLGPILGRIVTHYGGQNMYGVCQLLSCWLYITLVEVFVRPNIQHRNQKAIDFDTSRALQRSPSESSLFEGKRS